MSGDVRAKEGLCDEGKAHGQAGGESGPSERRHRAVQLFFAVVANGFVDDDGADGSAVFGFFALLFGQLGYDYALFLGFSAIAVEEHASR